MYFKASFDKPVIVASLVIGLLLLACLISFIVSINRISPVLFYSMLVIWMVIIAIALGFSVVKYQITPEAVVVIRPFINKTIYRRDIAGIKAPDPVDLKWSWRIFGNSGFFGYYGIFTNKTLGTMRWYRTRRDKPVIITTHQNKKLVISPDDPDDFICFFYNGCHTGPAAQAL